MCFVCAGMITIYCPLTIVTIWAILRLQIHLIQRHLFCPSEKLQEGAQNHCPTLYYAGQIVNTPLPNTSGCMVFVFLSFAVRLRLIPLRTPHVAVSTSSRVLEFILPLIWTCQLHCSVLIPVDYRIR